MKKTAKEMFEELGWKYNDRRDKKYCNDILCMIKPSPYKSRLYHIRFDLYSKDIVLDMTNYHNYFSAISPKLLQAINKQVEELGWGKEEENE